MLSECGDENFPLDLLDCGQEACIAEVTGNAARVHQLAEIGLRQGCFVRMISRGEPCVVAIDGRRLSVRLHHDVDVMVRPSLQSRAG